MVAVGDRASADYANARPRVLTGTTSVNVTTAGTAAFIDISFPAGFFPAGVTSAQVSIIANTTPQNFSCSYASLTPTAMRVWGARASGTGTVLISWTVFGPES